MAKRDALAENRKRGERLKKLRRQVEYADLRSVAEGARLSQSGIRKWEEGKPISRESLQKLARYYGANPRWIQEGKGQMLRPGDHFLDRLNDLEEAVEKDRKHLEAALGITGLGEDGVGELAGPVPPDDSGEPGGEASPKRPPGQGGGATQSEQS